MYDFSTDKAIICDIDFFKKAPVINDKGTEQFGTKRLKAPEEYKKGSAIDEQTNIFTLRALIFEFLVAFLMKKSTKDIATTNLSHAHFLIGN